MPSLQPFLRESKVFGKELSSLGAAGDPKGDQREIVLLRKELSICVVLFPLLILACLLSCSSGDETTAIRELIKQGAQLGEEHDISGLINLTSDDFVALPGNLDRRETRRILWLAFRHYGSFKVLYPLPSVDLKPDRRSASAVFPFLILRKDASFPKLKDLYEDPQKWLEEAGENADLYRLKLQLIKLDGRWVAKQALLERFTGISFEE
jgi:hypothetical protein